MRQTLLFTKTRKEAPKDELTKNASLLIRGGFIHKELAGVYSMLPLGLKVLQKISQIIREEMEALGAQELFLSTLQDSYLWQKTERWDDEVFDVWFKTRLKNKSEVGLAATHEEPLTAIVSEHLSSYKELPLAVFQIQTKFRNETRAKSGLIRGREFLMKDLYSFSKDKAEHQKFYEKVKKVYLRIFKKAGLPECFLTLASGGSFSEFSHEFQVPSPAGEDTIFLEKKKSLAINKEIFSEELAKKLKLSAKTLEEKKSIEVGNIFELGTRFSEALGLSFLDKNGVKRPVYMGSYGIGIGRLMGTIAEVLSDKNGLVWPSAVAPFKVHLLRLADDSETLKEADSLYKKLLSNRVEALYDDRELSAGVKFGDADLLGLPVRVVVSPKTVSEGVFELKERATGKLSKLNLGGLLKFIENA
ncbi:MAG: prolyl-tRNA synthetase [Parcubacteria group bacterium Gr01-1014_107]|nr:MAG: prolyl-tRNA synthetase [Parcubacteria group bacterium Gr01-1014_107]